MLSVGNWLKLALWGFSIVGLGWQWCAQKNFAMHEDEIEIGQLVQLQSEIFKKCHEAIFFASK